MPRILSLTSTSVPLCLSFTAPDRSTGKTAASRGGGGSQKLGGEERRSRIKSSGGVAALITMLDGSNLPGAKTAKQAAQAGGWEALKVGVVGAIELREIFPGSLVDFGVRIGMQEQAATALGELTLGDPDLQQTILQSKALVPLLSLVQYGSPIAAECAARVIWNLASNHSNQSMLMDSSAIHDLVNLVKTGSEAAKEMAAAGLGALAEGYLAKHGASLRKKASAIAAAHAIALSGADAPEACEDTTGESAGESTAALPEGSAKQQPSSPSVPEAETQEGDSSSIHEPNRLRVIAEAGGIPPLVKLMAYGTAGGKEKAAAALCHMAMDTDGQVAIAANGGIMPLVAALADGSRATQADASQALTNLSVNNAENQAQIAKKMLLLLDHDDPNAVTRAARNLQSLANDHPGASIVIVNAGAISPLVGVLSNGKTDESRNEAAKTLHVLANSGAANQLAIAKGLVALLGVGSDDAQEYVTALLLDLAGGSEDNLANRKEIANAGPFSMLVKQLRSDSRKVQMLAAAVMSKLSGDSSGNVDAIAEAKGITPLVALLDVKDPKTKMHSAMVLSDMLLVPGREFADSVAEEGGTPLLVTMLSSGHTIETKAVAASAIGSIALVHTLAVGKSGAIEPLVELLQLKNRAAQKQAAYALRSISTACESNQDHIREAGAIPLLVHLLDSCTIEESEANTPFIAEWDVQANVAGALGELGNDNSTNQASIAASGGIQPIITLITNGSREEPKEQAAYALWRLSSKSSDNQTAIANFGGISALVHMVGKTTGKGQLMAAEALASLALDNSKEQVNISDLLIQLLKGASNDGRKREKAVRAISRFSSAHRSNQDTIAAAGGVELIVSLLEPKKFEQHKPKAGLGYGSGGASILESEQDAVANLREDEDGSGEHHLIQKELASALWSLSFENGANQAKIAQAGGISLLVSLISDHPDIHRNAAGALWSLAADEKNRITIAAEGGIPQLVELLKTGSQNLAQESAAGALRTLAMNPTNRSKIADSGGIPNLIQLFDGGSEMAKTEVTGAILALAFENTSNQFIIMSRLTKVLEAGPPDASQAQNERELQRVEVQEHAVHAIYLLTKDREVREAMSRTPVIIQLVRELKAGSAKSQKISAEALVQTARMSATLRMQVTSQLVGLLGSANEDVRKRAGNVLREMNEGSEGSDAKAQKDAAMGAEVSPLVELLKDGLKNNRVEAQEYALWSLAQMADGRRGVLMVREKVIPPLIKTLNGGKIGVNAQEYAAVVLACLMLDPNSHEELISMAGITPMVRLLSADTVGAKKSAAMGLARLALSRETQGLIADEGALRLLIEWLTSFTGILPASEENSEEVEHESATAEDGSVGQEKAGTLVLVPAEQAEVAAVALADLARDNETLQLAIAAGGAIKPLIVMIGDFSEGDAQNAACSALATLAQGCHANQEGIAQLNGIPPLVELIKSNRSRTHEDASRALSLLAMHDDYKAQITHTGGIEPLVALLGVNIKAVTQQYAAVALEGLCRESADNQMTLANQKASNDLIAMLGSESIETAESAVALLLCLAEHPASQKGVIRQLVAVLVDPNVSAQLKATEALAVLSSRSSSHRTVIVKAGAVAPLVGLLGNGQRAELHTPPERAAAVLADIARLAESKVEIPSSGGIAPLVTMLSSSCVESHTHATTALFHLSTTSENKVKLTRP